MASRLPLGEHVVARESNHWIMQEQPELVIGAIENVRLSQSARAASVANARAQTAADNVAMQRIGKAAS